MPGGYHGRYLVVDATRRTARLERLDDETLARFVGGVGLGTAILSRESPARVDPLAPESALVFALSPLVGSPLTTSAKFAVVAKSPLTDRISDGLSSSRFAVTAKRTGFDALVVTGAADSPRLVAIDGETEPPRVEWLDASELWGLSARECERRVRQRLGADYQVASIGLAGERLIPFANISNDGRHAGRGGLGAVLGSKRIKAIAVRGERRVAVHDPERVLDLARDLSRRSMGPATEKYRETGTLGNLLVFNRLDTLPTRNFRESRFEEAERLVPTDLGPTARVARKSCAACTIGCEHLFASREDRGGVRLEYETLYALGPLCGVSDPEAVTEAARLCDEFGLDTISTGGTIALLMECAELGLIDASDLRFGRADELPRLIRALVDRDGEVGRRLALGSRRAAAEIGGIAPSLAMHVKGLELPGYDPRTLHATALGLCVGTRGADHNRSGAYEADLSNRVDRRAGGRDSAEAAVASEDKAAVMDSLILCKFLRGVFDDFQAEAAEMLRAVTGLPHSSEGLAKVGRRVVAARKLFNIREGWTIAEDTLPARLLEPGSGLTRERLDGMIRHYHDARGWTADGLVPASLARELGLEPNEVATAENAPRL